MRYRRLAKLWREGTDDEVKFVEDLLRHIARVSGHFRIREETWRRAETVWFKAVKLQKDRREDFPEPKAMFYLYALMDFGDGPGWMKRLWDS